MLRTVCLVCLLLVPSGFLFGCAGGSDGSTTHNSSNQGGAAAGDSAPPNIPPAPDYNAERAWADLVQIVSIGPRPAGSTGMAAQLEFLSTELKAVGLEPVRESFTNTVPVTDATPTGQIEFTNLYADLSPSHENKSTPLVIVASHMDTKQLGPNFVGANDGGSSTAAVLEIARALATGPDRAVTYRFLFLDGEEAVRPFWEDPDHTYGSRYHAKEITKRPISKRLKAFVLLDLVGDKDLVLTRDLFSTPWLQQLFVKAGTAAGHGDLFWGRRPTPIKDDHLSFKAIGVPVIDLIDFEYGPTNSYWHTDEDTLDKCSMASLRKIGEATLAGLVALERKLLE